MTQRICKKCLLRELPEADKYQTVFAYLENLDVEQKVPDEVYEARLAFCRDCEKLLSGMCLLCGCYVELRAARKGQSCPMVPARW